MTGRIPQPGSHVEARSRCATSQYVGPVTRYHVTLDRGGELQVLAQNLEEGSSEVLEARGRRVRVGWRPEQESVIDRIRGRIRMRRKRMAVWAALALVVGALSVVAAGCGGSDDSSSASTDIEGLGSTLDEIQANAKNEGQVNLVIWAGYADKSWADAVHAGDRLQGEHEGRRQLRRHGRSLLDGRVRRRLRVG